jgi:3-isopropylmalate/(R)-2-methylmalate dehydratase large subunit
VLAVALDPKRAAGDANRDQGNFRHPRLAEPRTLTSPKTRPRTLFAKLWDAHVVTTIPGGALIAVDRRFLHERMGSVALQSLRDAGKIIADPARVFATMDHIVDTRPGRIGTLVAGGQAFLDATRDLTRVAGICLFDIGDPDQGIVHVIGPELGLALPGSTIACPDCGLASKRDPA